MKLVEECEGIGDLRWRDETYAGVRYTISRYQAMMSSGLPVPGLHRIEGQLGLDDFADPTKLSGGSVSLRLEDGRTMNLTVTDDEGRVLAEGHGPTKCGCC
jgi:hypothetical protein